MPVPGSWLALMGLVLVLAGCSAPGEEDPDEADGGPGPTATTGAGPVLADGVEVCDLLTARDVRRLVGHPIEETRPDPVPLGSCIWDGGSTTWVTLVVDGADAWSEHVPDAFDASVAAGVLDREQRARFAAATRRSDGCDLFDALLRIKQVRGDVLVEPDPAVVDHRVLSAKTCADGRFVSVTAVVASGDRPPAPGDLRAVLGGVLDRVDGSG